MTLLLHHFQALEAAMAALGRVAGTAGHPSDKGTAREAVIRLCLADHLPDTIGIGMGEVIDESTPYASPRPQNDIVLFDRRHPRLSVGAGVSLFFAESVLATVEVKSRLDHAGLAQAVHTARVLKTLHRDLPSIVMAFTPPAIVTYVLAFTSELSLSEVPGRIDDLTAAEGVTLSPLPSISDSRYGTPAPSLDGVFVLGKGFIVFDNTPLRIREPELPSRRWVGLHADHGALLSFLLYLVQTTLHRSAFPFPLRKYLVPIGGQYFGVEDRA